MVSSVLIELYFSVRNLDSKMQTSMYVPRPVMRIYKEFEHWLLGFVSPRLVCALSQQWPIVLNAFGLE
jgi:hypothetical protein